MGAPFALITQGPSNTTGKNYSPQSLFLDRQNALAGCVGDLGQEVLFQSALDVKVALTAITTVTTAQNLYSKTLNKGALNRLNRTILISGSLIYTSPGTTAPKLTLALVIGGVTVASIQTASLSTTASTNMPVQFQFYATVSLAGATGTFEAHGQVTANISANTPAAAGTSYLDTNTAASSAVDLTTALTVALQASADLAISSIQCRQLTFEIVS